MVSALFKLNKNLQQRQFEKSNWIYPVHLAMYATHLRNQGYAVVWDQEVEDESVFNKVITDERQIDIPFLELPAPDRSLTRGMDPKWQTNGNFKHHPGTYILASSGCWYGKCSFCVESKKGRISTRTVKSVIDELVECKRQGYREVFDDCGTFPVGKWLTEFCVAKCQNKEIADYPISCNMRVAINTDYPLMKLAGFRMLLYGLESANQSTLDILKKRTDARKVIPDLKRAAEAGLEPHVAVMFGYPWESAYDDLQTLKLVQYLLRKGYAKTAQASLYTVESERNINRGNVQKIYDVAWSPEFWLNKFRDLKTKDDIKYLWRGIKEGLKR